jgi:hypothetical protein
VDTRTKIPDTFLHVLSIGSPGRLRQAETRGRPEPTVSFLYYDGPQQARVSPQKKKAPRTFGRPSLIEE